MRRFFPIFHPIFPRTINRHGRIESVPVWYWQVHPFRSGRRTGGTFLPDRKAARNGPSKCLLGQIWILPQEWDFINHLVRLVGRRYSCIPRYGSYTQAIGLWRGSKFDFARPVARYPPGSRDHTRSVGSVRSCAKPAISSASVFEDSAPPLLYLKIGNDRRENVF
jgi:hypothetical protein